MMIIPGNGRGNFRWWGLFPSPPLPVISSERDKARSRQKPPSAGFNRCNPSRSDSTPKDLSPKWSLATLPRNKRGADEKWDPKTSFGTQRWGPHRPSAPDPSVGGRALSPEAVQSAGIVFPAGAAARSINGRRCQTPPNPQPPLPPQIVLASTFDLARSPQNRGVRRPIRMNRLL